MSLQRRISLKFDDGTNKDEHRESWRVEEKHVLVHIVMVASSSIWARSEEKSQERKGKEQRGDNGERGKQT